MNNRLALKIDVPKPQCESTFDPPVMPGLRVRCQLESGHKDFHSVQSKDGEKTMMWLDPVEVKLDG